MEAWVKSVERQEAAGKGLLWSDDCNWFQPPKMTIKEIEYFHPRGKQMPNGSHFSRGGFLHDCAVNEKAFTLDEKVHGEQYGLAKYRGGLIIFSTDINAIQWSNNFIAIKSSNS